MQLENKFNEKGRKRLKNTLRIYKTLTYAKSMKNITRERKPTNRYTNIDMGIKFINIFSKSIKI